MPKIIDVQNVTPEERDSLLRELTLWCIYAVRETRAGVESGFRMAMSFGETHGVIVPRMTTGKNPSTGHGTRLGFQIYVESTVIWDSSTPFHPHAMLKMDEWHRDLIDEAMKDAEIVLAGIDAIRDGTPPEPTPTPK